MHPHSFCKSASILFAGCDYRLGIWIPGILLGLLSELLLKQLPKIHREKGRYSISANAEYQLNHSIVIQNLAQSIFFVSFCLLLKTSITVRIPVRISLVDPCPPPPGSGLPPSGG